MVADSNWVCDFILPGYFGFSIRIINKRDLPNSGRAPSTNILAELTHKLNTSRQQCSLHGWAMCNKMEKDIHAITGPILQGNAGWHLKTSFKLICMSKFNVLKISSWLNFYEGISYRVPNNGYHQSPCSLPQESYYARWIMLERGYGVFETCKADNSWQCVTASCTSRPNLCSSYISLSKE